MAPEVYKNEEYDTKVDVFSFALILQEVTFLFFSLPSLENIHNIIALLIICIKLCHIQGLLFFNLLDMHLCILSTYLHMYLNLLPCIRYSSLAPD